MMLRRNHVDELVEFARWPGNVSDDNLHAELWCFFRIARRIAAMELESHADSFGLDLKSFCLAHVCYFTTFLEELDALPVSINPSGVITGSSGGHGFVRAVDGTITTFDAGPCSTGPTSISPSGVITGWYFVDVISSSQGFVRYPDHHEGPENELDDKGGEGSANPE